MKKTIQKQLTLESCHIPIPVFWRYTLSASGINKKSFKHQCPECITESSLLSNFFAGARWGSTACQPRALSAGKSTQHEKTSHLCLYDLHCINILKKSQDSQPVEGVWKGVFHTNESASTVDVGDRIWYGFWVLHEHFGQWLLECVVRLGQHQLHDSSLSLNLQLATSVLPTCKTRVSKTSWTHFRIQNLSGNYWFEPQEMVSNIQAGHAAKYFQTTNAISVEGTYPWAAGRIKNASTFGMNFALVEAPVTVTDAWPMKGILEGEIYREKRVKSKQIKQMKKSQNQIWFSWPISTSYRRPCKCQQPRFHFLCLTNWCSRTPLFFDWSPLHGASCLQGGISKYQSATPLFW